jgi:hypothetical protein
MGKFLVAVGRVLPLCAMLLALPAIAASQCISQLSVQRVWTQDAGGTDKTAFAPGEPIRFAAELNNAYGGYLLAGNGTQVGIATSFYTASNPVDIPPGVSTWTWNATAPSQPGNSSVTVYAYDHFCGVGVEGSGSFTVTATGTTYYLSPSGSDSHSGASISAPWQTFHQAIPQLGPGDMLILLNGLYSGSNSGYLHIDCEGNANHGTASTPITIRAQHEREAFLQGDGSAAPFRIQNCSYWNIEGLRAENGDFPSQSRANVFSVSNSQHISLRRNLGAKNNRFQNSHIFVVVGDSKYVLLEENEAYDFHRHGFSISSSQFITLRRNYANSRGYADIAGGYPSHECCSGRGDEGITLYSATDSVAENNISEGNEVFGTFGTRNSFLGNIALNNSWGFVASHSCCTNRQVEDNIFIHNAAINSHAPNFLDQSAINTLVSNHTSYGSNHSGAAGNNKRSSQHGAYNWTIFPSITIRNSLFVNNKVNGIRIDHAEDYEFRVLEYLNAFGNAAGDYDAGTETRTNSTSIDPEMGACRVFLPDNSPMKGAGKDGGDIGANVLYVYENGQLTSQPLWKPGAGNFPCGATVPGVNDLPGSSCLDVHQRLNVHTNGCSLPSGYAGSWPPMPGPAAIGSPM